INGGPGVETQIGSNLFVTAATAVQLVSRVANQCDQLFFDKVMHILGFVVLRKGRRGGGLFENLLQTLKDRDQLGRRQYSRILQRSGVDAADGQLFPQQAPVEVERPLPALE